ncbi:MAG: exopolysaccharide biosynthesis protein [Rhodospirillales bacterium]|nr:exopolysaccharide biosynthesis protein [Rhodospirillales bacterium]
MWRLSILLGPAAAPLLLLVLSVPQILPIGIPGTGVALAAPMLFLAVGLLRYRQRVALPRWIGRRRLESHHFARLFSVVDRMLVGLERFSRPRAKHFLGRGMRIGIAAAIVLMVALILLPLPTGNPPAAASVVAFAVGLLRRDGLFALLGIVLALIAVAWNVGLAALIFVAGVEIWSIL